MHKNQFGITRMNLEHLKTFHVVASLGSFTEAAKALYRQLPAFFYSLPRGSLKTATVA